MSEVRGELPGYFALIGRKQQFKCPLVTTKVWTRAFLNAQHFEP